MPARELRPQPTSVYCGRCSHRHWQYSSLNWYSWDSDQMWKKEMTCSYNRWGWIITDMEKRKVWSKKSKRKTSFYYYLHFPLLLWQRPQQRPTRCLKAHCTNLVLVDASLARGMYLLWRYYSISTFLKNCFHLTIFNYLTRIPCLTKI